MRSKNLFLKFGTPLRHAIQRCDANPWLIGNRSPGNAACPEHRDRRNVHDFAWPSEPHAEDADRITTDRLREFRRAQQEQGCAQATINRSLSALRRMFNIAKDEGKLRDLPHFPMVEETNVRQGFFERAEYLALLPVLPDYVRVPFMLGYFTGMRKGEILGLQWKQVDFLRGVVRLANTKNGRPRTVPLGPELRALLEARHAEAPADCPWVCFRMEKGIALRVGEFGKVWRSRCAAAGIGEKLFHDLRRTGIRNLIRAGVPQTVAKDISGHKTDSVFDRYDITSERDILEAAEKLTVHLAKQDEALAETSGRLSGRPRDPSEATKTLVN